MAITTCIFDAYGTLFDVSAAAREAAEDNPALAETWPALASEWRRKQLEYTWLRAITGDHTDFWTVTQDALDWVLEAQGLGHDPGLRNALLALYRRLSAYSEVGDVLARLKRAGFATAILSNGSADMLADAVASAGIGDLLDDVLSVDAVGVFKPADAVYGLVGGRFGCARDEVLFVSSNGWDAAGAARYGFITAWVNRAGDPAERLGHPPHEMLPDLTTLPDIAEALR